MNKLFRTLLLLISSLSLAGFGIDAIALEDGGYDIFLLAGQSNMAGRGAIPNPIDADGEPESAIKMWDPSKGIVEAKDPIIHPEIGNKPTAVGMGMSFAKSYLAEARRNGQFERKVLLVGAAWGGTGFSEDVPIYHHRWMVTQDPVVGGDLYRTAVQRANAAISAALAENPQSSFKGLLWHQGESDANKIGSATYAENHIKLIEALRREIKGAANAPLVVGEMTPCFMTHCNNTNGKSGPDMYRRQVFDYIHDISAQISNSAWVSSEGLATNGPTDQLHFNTHSQRELGRRYFQKFLELSINRNVH